MDYQIIEINDLSVARNDELIQFDAEYTNFVIAHTDVELEYRINSLTSDKIKQKFIPGFDGKEGVFRKLYLTHPVGAGTIYLFCYR